MARGYQTADVQSLIQRKEGGPFGFLKQAFGNTMGKWAMNKRRPVGYETDKTAENVMGDPTEENWTNTTREALYAKLFGQKARFGEGIYTQDESGAYILNPEAEGEDAKKAKEIQIMMNESFAKAKKGKKVSHPDFPDAGESFYRGTDKTMGEAYYDEEGNIVDYWDIGLDEGEKVFDWKSIMPGGKPFVNKANLQRAIVDPFTTPATFTGKATDTGNILGKFAGFGGGDEDAPPVSPTVSKPDVTTPVSRDAKVPIDEPKGESLLSKVAGKGRDFMSGVKDKVTSGMTRDYADGAKTAPTEGKVSWLEKLVSGNATGDPDAGVEYTPDMIPKQFGGTYERPEETTIEGDGGGGRNYLAGAQDRLGEIFGAMKGKLPSFKGDQGFEATAPEEGKASWLERIVSGSPTGDPDEGVEYTPDMIPKKWGGTAESRADVPREGKVSWLEKLVSGNASGDPDAGVEYTPDMIPKSFGGTAESREEYDTRTATEGKGGGFNRQAIMKALGLGEDEEEEDYEATMMDRLKGLGYRGSAKQNVQLMERMGGRGPSIVDYLKGQGRGSSMDARRKLWQQYG